ncbi:MAG TPA: DUF3443 family protein [Anaeromyxobacter sp.]
MTSSDLRRLALSLLVAAACGGGGSSSKPPAPGGPNVVPISVTGTGCSASAYFNEPCVSVTVCVPGTSQCQVVNDVLLDTGSTGLRVFKQALSLPLAQVAAGGGTLGECIAYLDGASQWGPVVSADVVLGGEPAVTVPVHLVDATFATAPSACTGSQTDPTSAGYNAILGLNEWDLDCGEGCVTSATNGYYFACTGSSCAPSVAPATSQVRNPVAALPLDGNGIVVRLPAVPRGGAPSISGELVLGVGTRTNNAAPAGLTAFPLDPPGTTTPGELQTTIAGSTIPSFLDTGSNGIFFPATTAALTTCPSPDTSWFCPASPVTVSATNASTTGSPSAAVSFEIESIQALGRSSGVGNVGGPSVGPSSVDFGLPFFFGRDVYVVVEGRKSTLGTGPVVAY